MQLQEFKISRALGLSIKAWFTNFVPFTILAAVLFAPVLIYVMQIDVMETAASSENVEELMNKIFVYPVWYVVGASALLAPLLTYRVIQQLNGSKASIVTSIKYGLRGFLPALILAVVTSVANMIPMGGIIGAILTCIWFVGAPAAVAEQLGPVAALSRSATLTHGRRWGIFGLLFLINLVQIGLMAIFVVPLFTNDNGMEVLTTIKSTSLFVIVIMAVFQMFNGIVEAVSYALLRQDKDGVTHEELARVFE